MTAYLLTGEPQAGKTTALKKIVRDVGVEHFGGFYTEEIRRDGKRTAFQMVTLDGSRGIVADVSSTSKIRVGKYGVNLDVLESLATATIHQAIQNNKFVVIDEIGPMQLYSESFKQTVLDALNSSASILGTIVYRPYAWADELKQNNSVELYNVTKNNRDNMTKMLVWLLSSV